MQVLSTNRQAVAIMMLLALAGCGDGGGTSADGVTQLTVWAHRGKPAEWEVLSRQVKAFDEANDAITIELVEIAEDGYDTRVKSAAAARRLPDVLELDGPNTANYAWQGILQPLGPHVPQALREGLLPSIVEQGTYDGNLWSIGQFDSGLALYVNTQKLEAAGVRIPAGLEDAWTIEEFNAALGALADQEKQAGDDGQVLDLKRDYTGEWWTYGFYAPIVSAGGGLIDLDADQPRAAGTIDSQASVNAVRTIGGWVTGGLVDPNTDGRAFMDGRVAISWAGHWEYPRYREAIGENLAIVPLPDFGEGSRTGMGSWAWGISSAADQPEAAGQLIAYLLEDAQVLEMTRANGAVPATSSAVQASDDYGEGGALQLFAQQLESAAVPRPQSPAYPVITSAFQAAMNDVLTGGDAQAALQRAAQAIDRDVQDQQGYPPPSTR